MQNVIKREITINASKKKVYEAIADVNQIVKWFPDAVEGTLSPGERPIFDFGEYGKNQVYIVSAKPDEYFAYRWIPGSKHFIGDVLTKPNTLVEFSIVETNGVTRVTLTETGFANLPIEVAEKNFSENSGGWEFMLGRLKEYFA